MSQASENVQYVIIGRRSAGKQSEVAALLAGRPDFRVLVDRRHGERRRSPAVIGSDRRSGLDRRM